MTLYKIVVRERKDNSVVQIHEQYWTSVGTKLDKLIGEDTDRVHSYTITPLTK